MKNNYDIDQLTEMSDYIDNHIDNIIADEKFNRSFKKIFKRYFLSKINLFKSNTFIFSKSYRYRKFKKYEKQSAFIVGDRLLEFKKNIRLYLHRKFNISNGHINKYKVSAIIPSYNHKSYLSQRIESIINQTYPYIEIIIVDDNSTDGSQDLIKNYCDKYPDKIRYIFNDKNSGRIFSQWKKGIEIANGGLIWVCESDDYCENDFLDKIVQHFYDDSVTLAFGGIQYCDSNGVPQTGLDAYRESAERKIWKSTFKRPAKEWFNNGFAVKNVIPNVGGCVWRRHDLPEKAWGEAEKYAIMGDWYLYLQISGPGKIVYEPEAVSYFRIHGRNTSVKAQSQLDYYYEYKNLIKAIYSKWGYSRKTAMRFIASCKSIYKTSFSDFEKFDRILNYKDIIETKRDEIHVMIGILGFSYGGGEIFPIHLANSLKKKGVVVSVLRFSDGHDDNKVRNILDPSIPVYSLNDIDRVGIDKFFKETGVSVFHSHVVHFERKLLSKRKIPVPYFVTLHGSYESIEIHKKVIKNAKERVDRFFYLTERNISPFKNIKHYFADGKFVKFRNAVKFEKSQSKFTRDKLGISDISIVFCLVSRAIEGKGWVEAVESFLQLQSRLPNIETDLILVGDGPEAERARSISRGEKHIHFLGFQSAIHNIYELSDVAIYPSRFKGESFPLSLIEAMQVSKPIISTDVGEISNMISIDGSMCGVVIDSNLDNAAFVAKLSIAMETLLDENLRKSWTSLSGQIGKKFDIDDVAEEYLIEYKNACV